MKATRKPPSKNLLFLVKRMELRRWKANEIGYMTHFISEIVYEVKWIRHVRNCKGEDGCYCRTELVLAIERYGGNNCPWFLDINNDVRQMIDWPSEDFEEPCLTKQQAKYLDGSREYSFEKLTENPENFKAYLQLCPRIEDYGIGNYWTAAALPSNKRARYFQKTHAEAIRFIEDRMEWAERISLMQIRNACKYLKLLIAYDLDQENIPCWEPIFPFLG